MIICPIYSAGRKSLKKYLPQKLYWMKIFLMSNENDKIYMALGKFISDSFIIRKKIISLIVETKPHKVKLCVNRLLKLTGYLHHRNA